MNKVAFPFLLLIGLISCSDSPNPEAGEDKVQLSESNLIPSIYINGEPTWTIEERMEEYGVPGVSIAVINNGQIEWTKTYGIVSKETKQPVTDSTLFQAASISKPVSAYGALKMVEQGKIDLNANVNDYLQSWKLPENEFTADKHVSLKHLLNHSAGTTVHGFWGYVPGTDVPTITQVLNGEEPANSGAVVVDKAPEESMRYSGGGYCAFQQMMMDIEGENYPEIMDRLVLGPLDMSQSTYSQPIPAAWAHRTATGYLPDGSLVEGNHHVYPEMSPAGLWTTPEDLAKFAIDVQETLKGSSTKVLSQEMANQFTTPFVSNCGLGIFLDEKQGDIYFQHGGWNEGFSSQLMAHKDKGYGVVVMINSNHPAFIDELIRSVAMTYGWDNYNTIYERDSLDNVPVTKILGSYKSSIGGRFDISLEGDKIYQKDALGEAYELVPLKTEGGHLVFLNTEINHRVQFNFGVDVTISELFEHDDSENVAATKMWQDEQIPFDFLVAGDLEAGVAAYKALINADPSNSMVSEESINMLGYQQIWNGNLEAAKTILKANTLIYPDGFNTWDSYGEICFEMGENEEAIQHYEKSLELNPENRNALAMIDRIKGQMEN